MVHVGKGMGSPKVMRTRPRQIVPGVFQISLGTVNVFLLEGEDTITVVDAGGPGAHLGILEALAHLGRQPDEVKNILVTHCHVDHVGGLAALRRSTCAQVWVHAADAGLVRRGLTTRPLDPSPKRLDRLLARVLLDRLPRTVPPTVVDHELQDGDLVPVAGGLRVIHTPGHTAGHICLLLPTAGGVLLVGDAAAHVGVLRESIIYEDRSQGVRSLAKLATHEFEVACFAHGWPVRRAASARFRARWGDTARFAP